MATIPIFVSSTFRDFHGERDILAGPVKERLDELIMPLGCRVQFIDLRWGVDTSETDEEESQRRVLDVCLSEIERSRPLFLGLVGQRYGMVPDPAHARWVADRAGIPPHQDLSGYSITALEFRHAEGWQRSLREKHMYLVRDVQGPGRASWVDSDPQRSEAWRSAFNDTQGPSAPATRYRARVSDSGDGLDLQNVIVDDRIESLEDLFVEVIADKLVQRARDVSESSRRTATDQLFREDRTETVGRGGLIGRLVGVLTAERPQRPTLLGPSGVGKSTIVFAVEDELRLRGLPVASCALGAAQDRSDRAVVHALAKQIAVMVGSAPALPESQDQQALSAWWSTVLSEAVKALGTITIVVDGLDHLSTDEQRMNLWFLRDLPEAVTFLASTTIATQASVLFALGSNVVEVDALSGEEAAEAAAAWSRHAGRALPHAVLREVACHNRLPLWVRMAVDILGDLDASDFAAIADEPNQAGALASLLTREATALPREIGDLAATMFDRVRQRVGTELGDLVVGLLASSRSGLSLDHLRGLTESQFPNPDLLLARAVRALGSQLQISDVSGRMVFTHAAVAGAGLRHAPPDAHSRISGWLAVQPSLDDVETLDMLWHGLHSFMAETGSADIESNVISAIRRALQIRPRGTEAVLVIALSSSPKSVLTGIATLRGQFLNQEGIDALLAVDSYLSPDALDTDQRLEFASLVLQLCRDPRSEMRARISIGDTSLRAGDLWGALSVYKLAVETAKAASETTSTFHSARDYATCMRRVGETAMRLRNFDLALDQFAESLILSQAVLEEDPESSLSLRDLALSLRRVGDALASFGIAEGAQHYGEAVVIARRLIEKDPTTVAARRDASIALNALGDYSWNVGGLEVARSLFLESVSISEELLALRPYSLIAKKQLSTSLGRLGRTSLVSRF